MATSGTVDYSLTAGDVVEQAFSKIGVKEAEQPLQAAELKDGLNSLNLFQKFMQAKGLHLWTREEGVLFLDKGKTDYLVGPSGDKATTLDDFVGTTTTAAESTSSTVIGVASSAGMAVSDNVGIELTNGSRYWTTIASIGSATEITIANGITSAATLGASVFTFTNLVERPLRVTSFRRKTFNDDNEIYIEPLSRDEYFNQTNKLSQGTVVNAYYSPLLTNGRIYVWQTANSVNNLVRFSFQRSVQDIDNKTNTLDMPVEWLEPIIYNVAARLIDDYNVPTEKGDRIILKAQAMLEDVLGSDQEYESICLSPRFR